ncbi:MAG: tRNA lysidine(34) synthetase TilS [Alphaproteobacteria bacterium]
MAETLTASAFTGLMAVLGPFERKPHLAVAVSGGADSLALSLLAHGWARRRGGRVTALTVDHRLRSGSTAEARQVGAWLRSRSISHRTLTWTEGSPKGSQAAPAANLQARARAARYGLLAGWCRDNQALHLLIGHQREDQAETFLLRLARGSGVDGLAAMAPVVALEGVRILRPLLPVGAEQCRRYLRRRGQPWIEDPSNHDTAFGRVRVRAMLPVLAGEGIDTTRLAATAQRLGRTRQALEHGVAGLLAVAATMYPAGYCRLKTGPFRAQPAEIGLRGLARTLMCVGGALYPPRFERLERLYGAIIDGGPGSARTLGGCRIVPLGRNGAIDAIWICREAAAMAPPLAIVPGERTRWDGRFDVTLSPGRRPAKAQPSTAPKVMIGGLGRDGWAEVVGVSPELRAAPIPAPARPGLPALTDGKGVVAVPHLGYRRQSKKAGSVDVSEIIFTPVQCLAGGGFMVV